MGQQQQHHLGVGYKFRTRPQAMLNWNKRTRGCMQVEGGDLDYNTVAGVTWQHLGRYMRYLRGDLEEEVTSGLSLKG